MTQYMKGILCFFIIIGSGQITANEEKYSLSHLSTPALALVDAAFQGIKEGSNVDHHVHVVGLGDRVTIFEGGLAEERRQGCLASDFKGIPIMINPKRFRFWGNPILFVKTRSLMVATGIIENIWSPLRRDEANNNYVRHLLNLVSNYRPHSKKPGKFLLLAMDGHYVNGKLNSTLTDLIVPSRYVIRLSDCMNRLYQTAQKSDFSPFFPAISIHPERDDAIDQLNQLSKASSYLKWLPNTMNINPASPNVVGFLKRMKSTGTTLITHTGDEEATEALEEHQRYGNPSLHKQALAIGVNVIMAHSGYKGRNADPQSGEQRENTELFNKMLANHPNHLKGGLSATIFIEKRDLATYLGFSQPARMGPLTQQLERILADRKGLFAERLVYGSDYPLPSIGFLKPVENLAYWGFISEQQVKLLNEIWALNPLLYDFVLKRTIHHPTDNNKRLADSIFRGF